MLNEEYAASVKEYNEKKSEFYANHPEYQRVKNKKKKRGSPGDKGAPQPTKTAFDFYCESKASPEDTEVSRCFCSETLSNI